MNTTITSTTITTSTSTFLIPKRHTRTEQPHTHDFNRIVLNLNVVIATGGGQVQLAHGAETVAAEVTRACWVEALLR